MKLYLKVERLVSYLYYFVYTYTLIKLYYTLQENKLGLRDLKNFLSKCNTTNDVKYIKQLLILYHKKG